jgi:hypothetical protein
VLCTSDHDTGPLPLYIRSLEGIEPGRSDTMKDPASGLLSRTRTGGQQVQHEKREAQCGSVEPRFRASLALPFHLLRAWEIVPSMGRAGSTAEPANGGSSAATRRYRRRSDRRHSTMDEALRMAPIATPKLKPLKSVQPPFVWTPTSSPESDSMDAPDDPPCVSRLL